MDSLVEDYATHARWLAIQWINRGIPYGMDEADIFAAADDGLWKAAQGFEEGGADFKKFSRVVIHRAIMEAVRNFHPNGRVPAARKKQAEAAARALSQENGEDVGTFSPEVAEAIGLSHVDLLRVERDWIGQVNEGELGPSGLGNFVDEGGDPLSKVLEAERYAILMQAVGTLDERRQRIVEMHYGEDEPWSVIGLAIGGVSESRVGQLHADVIEKLRRQLQNESGHKTWKVKPSMTGRPIVRSEAATCTSPDSPAQQKVEDGEASG